jgi:hypothetical protein
MDDDVMFQKPCLEHGAGRGPHRTVHTQVANGVGQAMARMQQAAGVVLPSHESTASLVVVFL